MLGQTLSQATNFTWPKTFKTFNLLLLLLLHTVLATYFCGACLTVSDPFGLMQLLCRQAATLLPLHDSVSILLLRDDASSGLPP